MDRKRQKLNPEKVSVGSPGTMADSCCIAELKETIEKMNAELIQSHTKISELNAKVREQEEGQKEMSNLREENAQLARGLKESEEKCRAVQEKLKLAEQKLALFSQKTDATAEESLTQVNESNDDALGINSLPDEIIEKIFGYLTQNQLGQIARVCRRWNALTKSPLLWKKVNVKIFSSHRFKIIAVKPFINRLPSCVTSIRLNFMEYEYSSGKLHFAELCVKLQEKCPRLEELILTDSEISASLLTVIDVCTQFLQDVKKLVFRRCIFLPYSATAELGGTSKIEDLDLTWCRFGPFSKSLFSRLPNLKQLHLFGTDACDSWFEDDTSFLYQLHVLNVGGTNITDSIFPAIQNHGQNLKELYLCGVDVQNQDITFNNSAFPHLKTICLRGCYVTCEGVVFLIQSCPALENVYVGEDVAESFAVHPFRLANVSKSGIVKAIGPCHKH